jgi:glucokinase
MEGTSNTEIEVKVALVEWRDYEKLLRSMTTPEANFTQFNSYLDDDRRSLREAHIMLRAREIKFPVGAAKGLGKPPVTITAKRRRSSDRGVFISEEHEQVMAFDDWTDFAIGREPLDTKGHVFRWLVAERRVQGVHPLAPESSSAGPADLPAAVAAAAEAGDVLAMEALDLWLGAYGSVAGDLALQCLCRGGLWLGGGTAGKLLGALRSPRFFSAFQHKGRLAPQLETIPVRALIDPEAGLFSAACRARMLLA